jgi:two-component system, chemotaxis family, response regulator WspF
MRIGIANDLPIAVESLRLVLSHGDRHQLAWVARNGEEAVRWCARDKPDLILMDLMRPGMDGVAATRRIMRETPCPILIVTAGVGANTAKVFEALGAGALDAANTPVTGSNDKKEAPATLLFKIDTIAKLTGQASEDTKFFTARGCASRRPAQSDRLVAIGSSAGGPAALAAILEKLEPQFPAAVVVIQHLDEQFAGGLADWLNQKSALPVRLAREGDRPMKGAVLLAGSSDHLVFTSRDTLGYSPVPRECSYRPSVDVFLDSMVRHWDGEAAGVLLTGMGRDGARGLRALRDVGHFTLAQDRASCAVYGMPKAAAELDAAMEILPLEKIAPRLLQQFRAKVSP